MEPTTVPGRLISRRRFLQGSGLAILGLTTVGIAPRGSNAATTPPQPPTTLEALLEASPAIPTVGVPALLLDLAKAKNATPEALIASISEDQAASLPDILEAVDATFPYTEFLGNQPIETRREALQWAVGLRDDRPDLGSLRSDPPAVQSYDRQDGIEARNESWRAGVVLLLTLSASAAQVISDPPEQSDTTDEPDDVAPETTTVEP